MPRFAVELHASELTLKEDSGVAVGGARVWRVVSAGASDEAKERAITLFRHELASDPDILSDVGTISIAVEDIRQMRFVDRRTGTGIVFYIDTDDPRNQPPN